MGVGHIALQVHIADAIDFDSALFITEQPNSNVLGGVHQIVVEHEGSRIVLPTGNFLLVPAEKTGFFGIGFLVIDPLVQNPGRSVKSQRTRHHQSRDTAIGIRNLIGSENCALGQSHILSVALVNHLGFLLQCYQFLIARRLNQAPGSILLRVLIGLG